MYDQLWGEGKKPKPVPQRYSRGSCFNSPAGLISRVIFLLFLGPLHSVRCLIATVLQSPAKGNKGHPPIEQRAFCKRTAGRSVVLLLALLRTHWAGGSLQSSLVRCCYRNVVVLLLVSMCLVLLHKSLPHTATKITSMQRRLLSYPSLTASLHN